MSDLGSLTPSPSPPYPSEVFLLVFLLIPSWCLFLGGLSWYSGAQVLCFTVLRVIHLNNEDVVYVQWNIQFSRSVVSDSLWPNGRQYAGLPFRYQHLEFTQTHVHRVGDAIQPSHPLSSPAPPTFNLCQHQGLFQWVGSSHQVVKVLELQLQHQSLQWIFSTDFP